MRRSLSSAGNRMRVTQKTGRTASCTHKTTLVLVPEMGVGKWASASGSIRWQWYLGYTHSSLVQRHLYLVLERGMGRVWLTPYTGICTIQPKEPRPSAGFSRATVSELLTSCYLLPLGKWP